MADYFDAESDQTSSDQNIGKQQEGHSCIYIFWHQNLSRLKLDFSKYGINFSKRAFKAILE